MHPSVLDMTNDEVILMWERIADDLKQSDCLSEDITEYLSRVSWHLRSGSDSDTALGFTPEKGRGNPARRHRQYLDDGYLLMFADAMYKSGSTHKQVAEKLLEIGAVKNPISVDSLIAKLNKLRRR